MSAFEGWEGMVPPRAWKRILAYDVGGATANNLEWAAIDPDTQSLVFYQEVNKVTTNMRELAELSLPYMRPSETESEYDFIAKVGDYENRVALADMGRHGIQFTNAVKHNKNLSVSRLSAYLHPNPRRQFPRWHPQAGELGAPLLYMTPACKELANEIPQQKWKTGTGIGEGDSVKDELDRSIKHDAVDCALYIVRILPAPATIKLAKVDPKKPEINLQSKLYWEDVRKEREKHESMPARRPYDPSHMGGKQWKSMLGTLE